VPEGWWLEWQRSSPTYTLSIRVIADQGYGWGERLRSSRGASR